jgi:hypothetical protein
VIRDTSRSGVGQDQLVGPKKRDFMFSTRIPPFFKERKEW